MIYILSWQWLLWSGNFVPWFHFHWVCKLLCCIAWCSISPMFPEGSLNRMQRHCPSTALQLVCAPKNLIQPSCNDVCCFRSNFLPNGKSPRITVNHGQAQSTPIMRHIDGQSGPISVHLNLSQFMNAWQRVDQLVRIAASNHLLDYLLSHLGWLFGLGTAFCPLPHNENCETFTYSYSTRHTTAVSSSTFS